MSEASITRVSEDKYQLSIPVDLSQVSVYIKHEGNGVFEIMLVKKSEEKGDE